MRKKKIAFIATGGTIACVPGPEGMRPAFTEKEMIELVPEISEMAQIQGYLIMNIDSTNMQPEDWKIIAEKTADALEDCDGAVISHGTDTLAYTSSALTYMLTNLKKPVVITGSQRSIGEENSDAAKNLTDSFKVAVSQNPGVFVVFGGDIIIGDRASKLKTESFDAFKSINVPLAGQVLKKIQWNEDVLKKEQKRIKGVWEDLPKDNGKNFNLEKPVALYNYIDPRVLLVKLYPGIEPDILLYALEKKYHSVLIEGFGAGGVPFRESRNLINAIKKLTSSGIKVAITTQVTFEGVNLVRYEVGRKALEAGAVSTGDMTREAALVRLMMKSKI
jgi:L-asparaginase